MKKNVLIVILVAVILGLLYDSYMQRSKTEEITNRSNEEITSLKATADRLKMIADQNLNEAMLQSRRADEAQKKCK